MMVILLFTPCAEDKIVFPDFIFLFVDFWFTDEIKKISFNKYKFNKLILTVLI